MPECHCVAHPGTSLHCGRTLTRSEWGPRICTSKVVVAQDGAGGSRAAAPRVWSMWPGTQLVPNRYCGAALRIVPPHTRPVLSRQQCLPPQPTHGTASCGSSPARPRPFLRLTPPPPTPTHALCRSLCITPSPNQPPSHLHTNTPQNSAHGANHSVPCAAPSLAFVTLTGPARPHYPLPSCGFFSILSVLHQLRLPSITCPKTHPICPLVLTASMAPTGLLPDHSVPGGLMSHPNPHHPGAQSSSPFPAHPDRMSTH